MFTLFTLGSIAFWILLAIAVILVTTAIEINDSFGWATTTTIAFFAVLYYFGSGTTLATDAIWMWHNPGLSLMWIAIYLGIGIVWSFWKWYQFLIDCRERYERDNSNPNNYRANIENYIPAASEYKAMITSWWVYWPFSALWFVIQNPFRRIGLFIYDRIGGVYDKITLNVFHNAKVAASEKINAEETKA